MGADCFFRMGASHQVCQDYAAVGESNGNVYAALSDGCSSSKDSDFGARFLVKAALQSHEGSRLDRFSVIAGANAMAHTVPVERAALDATLLTVGVCGDEVRAQRLGDGVIVSRDRGGVTVYNTISFDNNMPQYLSYGLSFANMERYRSMVRNVTITSGVLGGPEFQDTMSLGSLRDLETIMHDRRHVDLVLLFSDGIESFQDEHGELIPLPVVLEEFMQFKGYAGQFIARRCTRFLKDAAKRGWTHADDLSCAGVYLEAP